MATIATSNLMHLFHVVAAEVSKQTEKELTNIKKKSTAPSPLSEEEFKNIGSNILHSVATELLSQFSDWIVKQTVQKAQEAREKGSNWLQRRVHALSCDANSSYACSVVKTAQAIKGYAKPLLESKEIQALQTEAFASFKSSFKKFVQKEIKGIFGL